MRSIEHKEKWETYRSEEISAVTPLLKDLGYSLDEEQVHVSGERFLMSGRKLVLLGRRDSDGKKVVVKVSSYPEGVAEIHATHRAQKILKNLKFAYRLFHTPEELLFTKVGKHTLLITEYVHQDKHFVDHPLETQFFLALRAFETQEGAHATTSSHKRAIGTTFKIKTAEDYLRSFEEYRKTAEEKDPDNAVLRETLERASSFLHEHKKTIALYGGFLTHSDFAPHNIRVVGNDLYLLDHTSIYFANKYEGWARFINFMAHLNPKLEYLLVEYIRKNKDPQEYLALRLMRVYKITFLLKYYASTLENTEGDLNKLNRERIVFWLHVLNAVLNDVYVEKSIAEDMLQKLHNLRSPEEKKRQKEIYSKD